MNTYQKIQTAYKLYSIQYVQNKCSIYLKDDFRLTENSNKHEIYLLQAELSFSKKPYGTKRPVFHWTCVLENL